MPHLRPLHRAVWLALALACMLLVTGCDLSTLFSDNDDSLPKVDFGDAYVVVSQNTATTTAPRLENDALHVTVQYSGGCTEHDFDLRFRTQNDTSELWLHHDAHNDACEAYLTETLTIDVPAPALSASSVVLLAPDNTPFPLR